mgnify:CR=1 FL=1
MTEYKDCDIPDIDEELPEDKIVVNPTSISFPDTVIWEDSRALITITNTGERPFFFKEIRTYNNNNAEMNFSIDESSITNGLKPGKSLQAEVTFSPRMVGELSGRIVFITLQDKQAILNLSGKCISSSKKEDSSGPTDPDTPTPPTPTPTDLKLKYWIEEQTGNSSKFTPKSTGNVHAYIIPKGQGSFSLNAVAGTRGRNSIDLQIDNLRATTIPLGQYAVITGGKGNAALGNHSFIGSGLNNKITGTNTAVVSGTENNIIGDYSFLGSGARNVTASGNVKNALVCSEGADIHGSYNSILSGNSVTINGSYNTVLYGNNSTIGGTYNTILQGINLNFTGNYNIIGTFSEGTVNNVNNSIILRGSSLNITNHNHFVGNVVNSVISGDYASIVCANSGNINNSPYAFIGTASNSSISNSTIANIVSASSSTISTSGYSTIVSGMNNSISESMYSGIVSGSDNAISSSKYTIITSGENNKVISSAYSTISSGSNNLITGNSNRTHNSITGGIDNTINESEHSIIVSGNSNSISSSIDSSIIVGKQNIIEESINSTIIGGTENVFYGSKHSSIVGGIHNQIMSDTAESAIIGGHRNTIEGANTVALAGNFGSDFGISHHVFHASKEGTDWINKKVDNYTGEETDDPITTERSEWINNNPICQTGTIVLHAMEDPSAGFYEGTSSYKKRLYTHSKKYLKDNVWGDLPTIGINNSLVVPDGCAFFWSIEINLFDFIKNTGTKILCENGIISNIGDQIRVIKKHTAKTLTDFSTETSAEGNVVSGPTTDIYIPVDPEQGLKVVIDESTATVYFELPAEYKDYISAAKLTYTLLTNKNIQFYWE